jgi:thioester reductase-like protein
MGEPLTLITGFPSNELATRVVTRLLTQNRSERLLCLVPARFQDRARAFLRERPSAEAERVELLEGDVTAMDLGLSGPEFRDAARRVRVIHHLAAVTYTGAERALADRVNVTGTAEVVEFASQAKQLERLVHWSSTSATSTRHGHVLEDDLLQPRSGAIAHTRFRAECIVRSHQERIPSTVLRPAMLAGDSRTGGMNRLDGAFLLITGLLSAPRDVPLPLPARPDAFLNLVPIDFAVEAGLALARSNDTLSRTVHVVDPAPPTLEEALGLFASLLDRPTPHRSLPGPLARALLTLPLLDRLTHAHSALVEELGRSARYDDRYARPVLEKAGLSCPPFPSYAPKMAAFVQRQREAGSANKPPPAPVRLQPQPSAK